MSLILTDEQEHLAAVAREFAEKELRPRVHHMVATNEFPRDLYKRCGELGFWRQNISAEHGGAGKGMVETCIVMEELAKVSPAMSLVVELGIVLLPLMEGNPSLAMYLERCMNGEMIIAGAATDPKGQSNSGEWDPLARVDGDNYVLNGARKYITNNLSDIVMVLGLDEDRHMKAFFVVEGSPGYDNTHVDLKLGMAGSGGGTSVFTNCRVPRAMAIDVGIGDSQFYYRVYNNCAAEALGCAEGIFEKTLQFIKTRTHNFEPLSSMQAIAHKMTHLKSLLEVSKSAVYDAATMYDLIPATGAPQLEAAWAMKAESIKVFVSEVAVKVATECIKLHGGLGYHDPDIFHYLGDSVCYTIMDLTNEIHYDNMAAMLGLRN